METNIIYADTEFNFGFEIFRLTDVCVLGMDLADHKNLQTKLRSQFPLRLLSC